MKFLNSSWLNPLGRRGRSSRARCGQGNASAAVSRREELPPDGLPVTDARGRQVDTEGPASRRSSPLLTEGSSPIDNFGVFDSDLINRFAADNSAYPNRFEHTFGASRVSLNPRLIDYGLGGARALRLTIENHLIGPTAGGLGEGAGLERQALNQQVGEAIDAVLNSPEIQRCADVWGPFNDFFPVIYGNSGSEAFSAAVYSYLICGPEDKAKSVALAKLVETMLLKELEERFPAVVGDGEQPHVSHRISTPGVDPDPFEYIERIPPISFKSKTGATLWLTEIKESDFPFFLRMAKSEGPRGKSYEEEGLPSFAFAVLNLKKHTGDQPKRVALGTVVLHTLVKEKNIENRFRRSQHAREHGTLDGYRELTLEEFVLEEYGVSIELRGEDSTYDYDKEATVVLNPGDQVPPFITAMDYLNEAILERSQESRKRILAAIRDPSDPYNRMPVGVIEVLPKNEALGSAQYASDHASFREGEVGLGYLIAPEMNKLELATNGSIALFRFLRRKFGLKGLHATVDPGNRASVKNLAMLGGEPVRGPDRNFKTLSTDYTDGQGNIRPRIQFHAGEEVLGALLDDPQATADRARQEFGNLLEELELQFAASSA